MVKYGIIFGISFIALFLLGWGGLLLVVGLNPDAVNKINGTWLVPAIFGTYWLSVITTCIGGSKCVADSLCKKEAGK